MKSALGNVAFSSARFWNDRAFIIRYHASSALALLGCFAANATILLCEMMRNYVPPATDVLCSLYADAVPLERECGASPERLALR